MCTGLRLLAAPVKCVPRSVRQFERRFNSVEVHALHQVWRTIGASSDFPVAETLAGSYHCAWPRGRGGRTLRRRGVPRRGPSARLLCLKYASGAVEQKLATLRAGVRNDINLLVIIRQMVSSLLHPICITQSCCAKGKYSVAQELPGWACEWGNMVSCFVETLLCSPQKYSPQGNDFPSPVRLKHHTLSIWDNFGNVGKRRGKLWIWLWKGK